MPILLFSVLEICDIYNLGFFIYEELEVVLP